MSQSTLSAFALGFESQLEECQAVDLPVAGKVPEWLEGDLVRNGPAKFEAGFQQYRHWFDGLAKLHKFSFARGKVSLSCKFLATEAYKKATTENRIALAEFGTNPKLTLLEKIGSAFNHSLTDNANVNVTCLNEHYLAMTETVNTIEFDRQLNTIGRFSYNDKLSGQVTTAHPHYDFERRELYNLLIKLGPTNSYIIYKIGAGTTTRKQIASIKVKEPCYFHSFGVSSNYIVLVECPFVVNPIDVILGNKTYVESYSWKDSYPTRISVFSKDNGELIASGETEPFFCFHHVNTFERDGEVVIDLVSYPNAQIVETTYLSQLRDEKVSFPMSRMRRLRISLASKKVEVEDLSNVDLELPRIHYERFNGKSYTYLYAPGQDSEKFFNRILKLNVNNSNVLSWQEDGCYPGEPVFVARPGSANEDDGVLLSVVFDSRRKSFLLILDAASMNELARLELPLIVPFGFHGQFYN